MVPAMKIGFIGAGAIAQALAKRALKAGCEVVLSNSRGPATLVDVVRDLGPGAAAGEAREAAAAPIVVLALPWHRLAPALGALPPWEGRIVIDTTNPIGPPDFEAADLGGRASSAVVADLVPGARLVKACNTLPPRLLAADPHQGGGRRVIFVSGDEAAAKEEVAHLLGEMGFAVIDLGELERGGRLQEYPGGPLAAVDLIRRRIGPAAAGE
jgi:8-hydroxy-5-deazaflavin:NADPH oxidoreductase